MKISYLTIISSLSLLTSCAISPKQESAQTASNLFSTTIANHQSDLRGSLTPERLWWNLLHYHLDIKVEPSAQSISGGNTIKYEVLSAQKRLQIELQPPMVLDKVIQDGNPLKVDQDGYSYFIHTKSSQTIGSTQQLTLYFHGKPKIAVKAPWDGGLTWSKDENGLDFIASSNQGIGASIWWPNKEHAYDEPDNGILMSVEVPEQLVDVSNGRLIKVDRNSDAKTKTYHWQVTNPINNYSVNINIGDYVHFGEKYQGEKGSLDMDYWVLRNNLEKAKHQFKDAQRTLEALEYWFGPYPFYEDSYKLVEAPYLGMEHQSSVTYGNKYKNGYLGKDRSSTGAGLLFDFIIVHESAHEWFANNITAKDVADLWIHESFANYAERLFLEFHYGEQQASLYGRGQRMFIRNKSTIIGDYTKHTEGSGDMYDKGGNMLHTIRQIINNDEKWREILRGLNKTFYHQVVTSKDIENYISTQSGIELSKIFDQYLRDIHIPRFEYFIKDKVLKIRWANVIKGFDMPLKVTINGKAKWLTPTRKWSDFQLSENNPKLVVDPNFYISTLNILGH